jgi:hypothetical protein
MKLICISDTQGFHNSLEISAGDFLIHAGDLTRQGTQDDVWKELTHSKDRAWK